MFLVILCTFSNGFFRFFIRCKDFFVLTFEPISQKLFDVLVILEFATRNFSFGGPNKLESLGAKSGLIRGMIYAVPSNFDDCLTGYFSSMLVKNRIVWNCLIFVVFTKICELKFRPTTCLFVVALLWMNKYHSYHKYFVVIQFVYPLQPNLLRRFKTKEGSMTSIPRWYPFS